MLALQLRDGGLDGVLASLEGLGEPGAAVGTFQFVGQQRRLGEDTAEILPNQLIESRLLMPKTSRSQSNNGLPLR